MTVSYQNIGIRLLGYKVRQEQCVYSETHYFKVILYIVILSCKLMHVINQRPVLDSSCLTQLRGFCLSQYVIPFCKF